MSNYTIGTRIRLVSTGPFGRYDGTTSEYGRITGRTRDDGIETYSVVFEDGKTEEWLHSDEFEVLK